MRRERKTAVRYESRMAQGPRRSSYEWPRPATSQLSRRCARSGAPASRATWTLRSVWLPAWLTKAAAERPVTRHGSSIDGRALLFPTARSAATACSCVLPTSVTALPSPGLLTVTACGYCRYRREPAPIDNPQRQPHLRRLRNNDTNRLGGLPLQRRQFPTDALCCGRDGSQDSDIGGGYRCPQGREAV